MIRDIPLQTAAVFLLANLFLKQGISPDYGMVDFICMGLLDLWRARTENYKMKNSCPQLDSNPAHPAYKANALSVALLVEVSIEHLNVDRVLHVPLKFISIVYHVLDVVKCFVVYKIVLTLYSQQTS